MSSSSRRLVIATLTIASLGLSLVGLAWACTPQATLDLSEASGVPGDQVVVTGTNFLSERPVEIHWASYTGPLLATAQGPSFSTTVTIPDYPEDHYVIVGVAYAADGSMDGNAPAAFEIVGQSSTGGGQTSGSTTGSDEPAATGDPATSATTSGDERSASTGGNATGTDPGKDPQPNNGTTAGTQPEVTTSADGATVFAGSLPRTAPTTGSPGAGSPEFFTAPQPTERTATGDLWSGFAAGSDRALPGSNGFVPLAERPGTPFVIGLTLLGFSVVVLMVGFGVVALRRRKAEASGGGDRAV